MLRGCWGLPRIQGHQTLAQPYSLLPVPKAVICGPHFPFPSPQSLILGIPLLIPFLTPQIPGGNFLLLPAHVSLPLAWAWGQLEVT